MWAPTATEVQLLYYGPAARGGTAQTYPMTRGPRGTWTLPRPASWLWHYYTYRVTAYNPWTNRFEVRPVVHGSAARLHVLSAPITKVKALSLVPRLLAARRDCCAPLLWPFAAPYRGFRAHRSHAHYHLILPVHAHTEPGGDRPLLPRPAKHHPKGPA